MKNRKHHTMKMIGLITFVVTLLFLLGQFFFLQSEEGKKRKIYFLDCKWEENKSNIQQIEMLDTATILRTDDGSVWMAGQHKAIGTRKNTEGMKLPSFYKLRLDPVKKIAVGNRTVFALTEKGEIYAWGSNEKGMLANGNRSEKLSDLPQKIELKQAEQVVAKGNNAAALTQDGDCYIWGYVANCDTPKKLLGYSVEEIYLTKDTIYLKEKNKKIYSITLGEENKVIEEKNLNHMEQIIQAGDKTFAMMQEGNIAYLTNKENTLEKEKILIETIPNVVDVACNSNQVYLLTAQGYVYRVQLDEIEKAGEKGGNFSKPKEEIECMELESIEKLVQNTNATLFQTKTGEIWNVGQNIEDYSKKTNSYGSEFITNPQNIGIEQVTNLVLGEEQIMYVTEDGRLYGYGKNEGGKLAVEGKHVLIEPVEIIKSMDKTEETKKPKHYEEIKTYEDLQQMKPDGNYMLVGDIDLEGKAWEPISEFSGILEGNGHCIQDLRMLREGKQQAEPISLILKNKGTIRNLGLEQVAIWTDGNEDLATLVQENAGSIENCYAMGDLTGSGYVSGLVGTNTGSIQSCLVEMNLTSKLAGSGIATSNLGGNIQDCIFWGNIQADYASGIVNGNYGTDQARGKIENCINKGTIVSLTGDASGIAFANTMSDILNCKNKNQIKGKNHASGIVTQNYRDGKVKQAKNYGQIMGKIGAGICADLAKTGSIEDCESKGKILADKKAEQYRNSEIEMDPKMDTLAD